METPTSDRISGVYVVGKATEPDLLGYIRYKVASIDLSDDYRRVIREAGWVEARKVRDSRINIVFPDLLRAGGLDAYLVNVDDLKVLGINVTGETTVYPVITFVGGAATPADMSAADFYGK